MRPDWQLIRWALLVVVRPQLRATFEAGTCVRPTGPAMAWAMVEVDRNPPATSPFLFTLHRFGTDFFFFFFGTLLSVSFPTLPGLTEHKRLRAFGLAASPVAVDCPGRIE